MHLEKSFPVTVQSHILRLTTFAEVSVQDTTVDPVTVDKVNVDDTIFDPASTLDVVNVDLAAVDPMMDDPVKVQLSTVESLTSLFVNVLLEVSEFVHVDPVQVFWTPGHSFPYEPDSI